ncbi:hypothetical protein HU200_061721 [Digitaria exilis]|uniref:Reverse transcriptase zinc-binding domain-containing protein n=1 Tax=Digitaria exilis TaxID=1010633 RepID=A0A835DWH6_9POAL|nr:hypothetical protein HU200_061721 [Digitaria exilis]
MVPFTSKGYYSWVMNQRPPDPFTQRIWRNIAIPRCRHFLWLLHHHRLPSAALLHRRNIIESPLCALCGEYEDQHHILLTCPRARRIWRLLNWSSAPHLQSFRDLWDAPELPDADPRMLSAIITAILWNIWKARNSLQFNGCFLDPQQVIRAAITDLQLWSHRVPTGTITAALMEFQNSFVI